MSEIIKVDLEVGQKPDAEMIEECFKEFSSRLSDYKTYQDYYSNKHTFTDKEGAKITVNLVRYCIQTIVSYMAGNPPNYVSGDGDANALKIIERFDDQNMRKKEAKNISNMRIFGRSFELVYHNNDKELTPKSVFLKPCKAFVAYNQAVDPDSVFGAVVRTVKEDKKEVHIMDVYGPGWYQEWKTTDNNKWTLSTGSERTTRFTRVPLIEYVSSEDAMSDVEIVMSLQDALNSVMSDRQDDKDAFAGAVLALYGTALGFTREEIELNKKALKDTKVLHFENKTAEGAEFLIKQMDEAGASLFIKDLTEFIHMLLRSPNLMDEQFSGNASGVAMAYKLYGTQNVAKESETSIEIGFRRRCKLYDDALNNQMQAESRDPSADVSKMNISFNYNVTIDPASEASAALGYLNAGVSQQTVLGTLSIVDDVDKEMERLKEQKAADLARERSLMTDEFGLPQTDEEPEEE